MTLLKIQAIQKAVAGDWNSAIALNQELLRTDPEDIETLIRLAFALTVIGKTKEAKGLYQKVLRLDNHNPIAIKNLKRLMDIPKKSKDFLSQKPILSANSMFIEESGKTKTIELINVAEPKVISNLMTAELLELRIKRLKIFVLDERNRYIGMLPEDIGKRLIRLLKGGNKYEACIKAIENHQVTIFIKELKRCARFINQPSFISSEAAKVSLQKKNYLSKAENEEINEEGNPEQDS